MYHSWEEIFDNGVQILPDTVVDVWKGGSYNETIQKVTAVRLTCSPSLWLLPLVVIGCAILLRGHHRSLLLL